MTKQLWGGKKWDKEKKRERASVVLLSWCDVSLSVAKFSFQTFMWLSWHLSYPLPSVWLGWPWSPKSRSSPLNIRLPISPHVECVMPLHGYPLSHHFACLTTTCLLQTWTTCITSQNVENWVFLLLFFFRIRLSSGLSMTECACIYFSISGCPRNQT